MSLVQRRVQLPVISVVRQLERYRPLNRAHRLRAHPCGPAVGQGHDDDAYPFFAPLQCAAADLRVLAMLSWRLAC